MQEILINKNEEFKRIMLVEDGKLVENYIENEANKRLEGNIYVRNN